ncbi:MAG: hypothetical protein U0610_33300 [bacterium]
MKEVLLALAAVLAPADGGLAEAIRAAIEAPQHYVETHAATADRLQALDEPGRRKWLPWLALVDELIARHRAVELDWKLGAADVIWNLEQLAGYAALSDARKASITAQHCEGTTLDCLRAIARLLGADQRVLAALDIASDSYVLVLLSDADYAKASPLAHRAGFTLKDIRTFDPNE